MANEIEIVLRARDAASGPVSKAAEDMRDHFGRLGESIEALTRRALPALEGRLGGLAGLMRGSAGGAVSGLVGAFISYGVAVSRVADEQARFGRVLNSMDAGALRGELGRVNAEMSKMLDIGNRIGNASGTWGGALQSFISRFRALPQALGEIFLGQATPESQRAQILPVLGGMLGVQEAARQSAIQADIASTRQRALLYEQQRLAYQGDLRAFNALQPLLEAADRQEEALALRALRQQQGLRRAPLIAEGIPTTAMEKTFEAEEQALRASLGIGLRGRKLAREQQAAALLERLLFPGGLEGFEGQAELVGAGAAGAPDRPSTAAWVAAQAREAERLRELFGGDRADAFEGGAEAIGVGPTAKELTEGARRQSAAVSEIVQLKQQALDLDNQILAAQGNTAGLSEREAMAVTERVASLREINDLARVELELTDARRRNDFDRVGLLEKQKDAIVAIANAEAMARERQRLQRDDPTAGLIKGLEEAAEAGRQWGTAMQRAVQGVGQTIERTLSDALFSKFTGQKGEDLGKKFFQSLARVASDELAKMFTGSIAGFARQLFGGIVPAAGTGFSLLGGGGGFGGMMAAPGVTGVMTPGAIVQTAGGLGVVQPSGAVQLLSAGAGTMSGGGFDIGTAYQGVSALSSLSSVGGAFSGIGYNWAGGGLSGVAFGLPASVSFGSGALELGAGVGAISGTPTAATSGFLGAGGMVGGGTAALAAVGLALTIYSGLTGPPTVQNIVMNAASGAISGAIIGTWIYPGVGTIIGAIAGALLGGGSAALGKGGAVKKPSASERSRAAGEAGAAAFQDALERASSLEDLAWIFNNQWAPHGEVQIVNWYQGRYYWAGDWDDPPANLVTPADLIIPGFLDNLQVKVGETGATDNRPDLVQKFKDKVASVLENLSRVPFGILESDAGAQVTRRTYLPFQKLYELTKGTSDLFASSEYYKLDLKADDETIAYLLTRLREYNIRTDMIRDWGRDDFLFA